MFATIYQNFKGWLGQEWRLVVPFGLAVVGYITAVWWLDAANLQAAPLSGWLPVVFTVLLASVVGIVFGVEALLGIFVLTTQLDRLQFAGGLRLTELVTVGLMVTWLYNSVGNWSAWRWQQFKTPLTWPLVAFWVVNLGSALLSSHVGLSLKRVAILAYLIVLMHLLVQLVPTRARLQRLLVMTLVVLMVSAGMGIEQFLSKHFWDFSLILTTWQYQGVPRVPGGLLDPNFFAGYIFLAIPLWLGLAYVWRWRWMPIVYLGIGWIVVALIYSFSRSGYMAVGVVGVTMLVLLWNRTFIGKYLSCLLIGGIVAYGAIWLVPTIQVALFPTQRAAVPNVSPAQLAQLRQKQQHLTSPKPTPKVAHHPTPTPSVEPAIARLTNDNLIESGGARIYAYEAAVKMFEARPLLGFGPDMFPFEVDRYAPAGSPESGVHAHSLFFETLAEKGALGVLGLAWVIFVYFSQCWQLWWRQQGESRLLGAGLAAGMLGFLGFTLFLTGLYEFSLWLMLALVVMARLVVIKDTGHENRLSA